MQQNGRPVRIMGIINFEKFVIMFNFINNLFSEGKNLPKTPKDLEVLSLMFENGDFEGVADFLKKHQISTDDKRLRAINPHFETYFGEYRIMLSNPKRNFPKQYDVKKTVFLPASYYLEEGRYAGLGMGLYRDNSNYNSRLFVAPCYLENLIIDYTFPFIVDFYSKNLHEDEKWTSKTKNVIVKKSPKTRVHCFTKIYKPLIDNKFELLKIAEIDVIYIWLDEYSFYYNEWWFENQTKENLSIFPNKKLVFGCNEKTPFEKLILNLQSFGYKAEILEGFKKDYEFFNSIKV